jgi:hypothetical protein
VSSSDAARCWVPCKLGSTVGHVSAPMSYWALFGCDICLQDLSCTLCDLAALAALLAYGRMWLRPIMAWLAGRAGTGHWEEQLQQRPCHIKLPGYSCQTSLSNNRSTALLHPLPTCHAKECCTSCEHHKPCAPDPQTGLHQVTCMSTGEACVFRLARSRANSWQQLHTVNVINIAHNVKDSG